MIVILLSIEEKPQSESETEEEGRKKKHNRV
jgi:hypothetical protein